jgi:hypothetical protein
MDYNLVISKFLAGYQRNFWLTGETQSDSKWKYEVSYSKLVVLIILPGPLLLIWACLTLNSSRRSENLFLWAEVCNTVTGSAHYDFDRFQSLLLLYVVCSFFTNQFKFSSFFRFEIWHAPPAPQCVTFPESASTSDHRVTRDRPKSAGFNLNMLMRF